MYSFYVITDNIYYQKKISFLIKDIFKKEQKSILFSLPNKDKKDVMVLFIDMNIKKDPITLALDFRKKYPHSYISIISSYQNHREMISMQKKSFYFFYKFSNFEENLKSFLWKIKEDKLKNEILEIDGEIKIYLQKDTIKNISPIFSRGTLLFLEQNDKKYTYVINKDTKTIKEDFEKKSHYHKPYEKQTIDEVLCLLEKGLSIKEISLKTKVSVTTICHWKEKYQKKSNEIEILKLKNQYLKEENARCKKALKIFLGEDL